MFSRCATLTSSLGRTLAAKSAAARAGSFGFRYMSVINISDLEATEKFYEANDKSVLYFTATWCGPCQAIKPVYEGLSKEYEGIGFGKVDIDDNQDAAAAFQISSVPTFIFFNGKKPFKAFAGADTAQLESVVKELDEA